MCKVQSLGLCANMASCALVLNAKWLWKILDGSKTWEVRGKPTTKRGVICLASSGSSRLYGQVEVYGCLLVGIRDNAGELQPVEGNHEQFIGANFQNHQIEDLGIIKYQRVYAWLLRNPVTYDTPQKYLHPRGAITWVRLSDSDRPAKGTRGGLKKPRRPA